MSTVEAVIALRKVFTTNSTILVPALDVDLPEVLPRVLRKRIASRRIAHIVPVVADARLSSSPL
jgi:hypothetical protein